MLAGGPAVLALLTVLLVAAEVRPALAGVLAVGFVVGPVAAAAPEVTLPPDAPGCADASKPNITQSTAVAAIKRKANWRLKFIASIFKSRRKDDITVDIYRQRLYRTERGGAGC
jgi:hypothetical protein